MTKTLIFEKDYSNAATYRGPAYRFDIHCGSIGLAPNAEQLEAAAKTAMNEKGVIPLRIKIYFEETIPTRHIYYELYGYSSTARAIAPLLLAAYIIAGIIGILSLYLIWQIAITGKEIIWGPSEGGFPWGAIVILAIVGVAGYFLITHKKQVTRVIEAGKPIARRAIEKVEKFGKPLEVQ